MATARYTTTMRIINYSEADLSQTRCRRLEAGAEAAPVERAVRREPDHHVFLCRRVAARQRDVGSMQAVYQPIGQRAAVVDIDEILVELCVEVVEVESYNLKR